MTTTATFRCVDASSIDPGNIPWKKLDCDVNSADFKEHSWPAENVRGREAEFPLDTGGFAYHRCPTEFQDWDDIEALRERYYREVEAKMLQLIPGAKRAIVFAHVLRYREHETSKERVWGKPRQPAHELHVDNNAPTVANLVRAMITDKAEVEEALKGRFGLVNMWRPIDHPASDHPIGVGDFRSMTPAEDFVTIRLLLPFAQSKTLTNGVFDTSHLGEKQPLPEGYDAIGQGLLVKPNPKIKFYYCKDLAPDEVLLIKCYDSFGEGEPNGKKGVSVFTPHGAFKDPQTPADAPLRKSIEARCLILW